MNDIQLSEQEIIRRKALKELRNLGNNPYPAEEYPVSAYSKEILELAIVTSELYEGIKRVPADLLRTLKSEDDQLNKIYEGLFEIRDYSNQKDSEKDISKIYEYLKEIIPLSRKDIRKKLKESRKFSPYIPLKKLTELKADKNLYDVSLAGRIMTRRIMGNASFIELQDSRGRIQAYFRRDTLCPGEDKTRYNTVFKKLLDIGDIIGIKGNVFKTRVGETTVNVKEFTLLSKSLRPLPIVKEKEGKTYDAFTDPEQRYRNRSLDLIVNPQVKEIFIARTRIVNTIREFLNERGYLEVETPVLQPVYGGAAARPFKTYHHRLDQTLYLRIANELYLKRIIVGGFDGIYEFARDFRNEGLDRYHNPEFTQMEIYVAYKDYEWMMGLFEEMIEKVAVTLHGSATVKTDDHEINLSRPWKRYTMFEAIEKFTGKDISGMDEDALRTMAEELNIEIDESMGKGKLIDEIFSETTEPNLIQPTIIMDYPVEMSPLSKKHRSKPGLVERFEVIVNGKELCNAFSELNDPVDQRGRFEQQLLLGKRGDKEAMVLDEDFLKALELGMPPTAGLGVGIDRLTMLMTGAHSIQDVIFFPQMRPGKKETVDPDEKFTGMGIPKEWVPVLKQLGYITVEKLKEVEKPGKLANDLNGYNKKNKLGLKGLSPETVTGWFK